MDENSPVSAAKSSTREELERLLNSRQVQAALSMMRKYWLVNPDDPEAVSMAAYVAESLGKTELAEKLKRLGSEKATEPNLQNLFEIGFHLIDARELQLAVMILQRCAKVFPEDPTINYELGFALMSTRQFKEAIKYFELAAADPEDFDSRMNLSVCYTMIRDTAKVVQLLDELEKLEADEDQKKELINRREVLKRLEKLQSKPDLTPRDWLYILYGSILLNQPDLSILPPHLMSGKVPPATKPENGWKKGTAKEPSYDDIAWTLLVLQQVLVELGFDFDVIEYYSPLSRPLAEALAQIMDLPVQGYRGPDFPDRALLVMAWGPNIVGPHKSFVRNSHKRMIFSFALPFSRPLPLTPDLVGQLSQGLKMPWATSSEEEWEEQDIAVTVDLPDEEQAVAMEKILERVHHIQSLPQIIHTVEEIVTYYKPKKDMLVAGNAQQFADRPEYTAEIIY